MMARAKRPPRGRVVDAARIPAPLGGVNTVDAGAAMPPTDAVWIWNMLAAEYGLRSRLGWREWCTGLTGTIDNTVRSILPFAGSHKNGSTDKLFACTTTGIWDVSASSSTPTRLVEFARQGGEAGYGAGHVVATPAGRFLVYCDEENGLFVWSEDGASWTQVLSGATQLWAPSTVYTAGNRIVNGGNVYSCSVPGTSATSGGPTGTGTSIVDGTVTWAYVSAAPSSVIGPSLSDQQRGLTADPASFAHVTVWKSRVWFTEKDSSRGWYLDVGSIFGTATSFDFGMRMRAGGPLVGLYNWSYDGGNGLDTLLVGISSAGDVVIYQGTDPTSANTFGLKGTWSVGAVPYGRRIATEHGGELLILSALGVVPLSKLLVGAAALPSRELYATGKIANLFNALTSTRRMIPGWGLHIHPTDNALLVTVPTGTGPATEQLVMSFATRGWSRYRNLNIVSGGVWAGDFWFGDDQGRVCRNIDYVDGVTLSNPNSYAPVAWSVLPAYQSLGSVQQKRVQMIRPIILSGSQSPVVQSVALYDFNLLEPDAPSGSPTGGWDSATWDASLWGGDYSVSGAITGASGLGRDVSVALRGSANSRTILVGVDVLFEQGGLL